MNHPLDVGIAGTNREGMRKYRRFVGNPEGSCAEATGFAVGNPALGCRPPDFARPDSSLPGAVGGSPYAAAVTALSRNGGAFLPIPREKAR